MQDETLDDALEDLHETSVSQGQKHRIITILYDPQTLLHETTELLASKIKPALEYPERIKAIVETLENSPDYILDTDVPMESEAQTPDWEQARGFVVNHGSRWDSLRQNKAFNPLHDDFRSILNSSHDAGYLSHLRTAHDNWVRADLIEDNESILPECFCFETPAGHHDTKSKPAPPKDIFAQPGYYAFDMSSGIARHTYESAIASAMLAYWGAVDLMVMSRHQTPVAPTVVALTRPPGHHCTGSQAGGYCYINNGVVAAETLIRGLPVSPSSREPRHASDSASSRTKANVAILDLDFHHGNGVQSAFYSRSDAAYCSIHGLDEYPYYTGAASERGAGPGTGFNCNLPLAARSSLESYLGKVDEALAFFSSLGEADKWARRPDYLIVLLGFDTYETDPLGGFKISTEDYAVIARKVAGKMGGPFEEVPTLILLEGGYVVDRLGENLMSFLKGWREGRERNEE